MLIAQVTDTHIMPEGRLAYGKIDSAAALDRCVAHVNILDPRPDLVLLTGDLADLGRAEEYGLLSELLAPLAMPFFLIPGNHDDRGNLRAAFPRHGYLRQDAEFLHYTLDDWPLRLIGLDSVVPGEPGGHLCERRLAWLEARLSEGPERPTLLFVHHPPFLTGIKNMDAMNLANGNALGKLLERHPQVIRLIAGHVHRPIETTWSGIGASIAPSPSHAVALDLGPEGPSAFVLEPAACHLLDFGSDGRLVIHLSFIGSFDGPHPFVDSSGEIED